MSDPWSMRVSAWRNEAPAKSANATAVHMLDTIDTKSLVKELHYYLQTLFNQSGPNMLQSKAIEGPEDFPILLNNTEILRKQQARIRSIGLEAYSYKRTVEELIDTIKKTLQIRPEFAELRTVDQRDTIVRLVAMELYELLGRLEEISYTAAEVGKAYSDSYNFTSLSYNIVNAMSYHRNLYGQADPKNSAPRRF